MHEMSLVRSLLRQVEELRQLHGGIAIDQIEVEIGPLSGVEPQLLREAYSAIAPETQCRGARFVINEVPLRAVCQKCDQESVLTEFAFSCPACGLRSLRITQGDEFRLLNVTLQTPEPSLSMDQATSGSTQAFQD